MKKIFVRSPYFIEADYPTQTSVQLSIYLWNKGTTEPTEPQYQITENIPSPTQTNISINVSNYAKDFIKPIAPTNSEGLFEEDVNTWCYMKVYISYISGTEFLDESDETFICLNGFTSYSGGYNQYNDNETIPLFNNDIKIYQSTAKYLNVFVETATEITYNSTLYDEIDAPTMVAIPLNESINTYSDSSDFEFEVYSEELCEPKYTPIVCSFINRFGGWQFLTFFKANQQSIEVTSKEYNLMPSGVDYNVLQGQRQRFNFQGKQKIKCNTGWVDENYSELITDLMLSEIVLLDNKPAVVKSQNFDIKTSLKDKNINYEIEFEYSYGLINDVV